MTPQEESMLNDLIGRVQQTQLAEKDPEAEQLLNQQLGRNPNALYILAQTVLVQKYALEQATSQLEQMKQSAQVPQQPARATSFLGSLLGHRDPAPPPPPQYAPPPQQGWNTVPAYPNAPAYSGPPAYGGPPPSGGSSFLRSAATTAAGVAAGALAFEGVESLMHGFGHQSGFGGGNFMGGGEMGAPREEVINNYYGDSDRGSEHGRQDFSDAGLGDSGNDAANLQQAGDDLGNDNANLDDDVNIDSFDDSSSLDDSGSGDDLV